MKLIDRAIRDDDQAALDFVIETVSRERLYLHFASDAGPPIRDMQAFLADLKIEADTTKSGSSATASAGGRRRPTPQERHAERLARIRVAGL